MVIGIVVFFLFFFVRGFVQERQKQRVNKLQRDINAMRRQMNKQQMHQ